MAARGVRRGPTGSTAPWVRPPERSACPCEGREREVVASERLQAMLDRLLDRLRLVVTQTEKSSPLKPTPESDQFRSQGGEFGTARHALPSRGTAHHVTRRPRAALTAADPCHCQGRPRRGRVIAGHGGDVGMASAGLLGQRMFERTEPAAHGMTRPTAEAARAHRAGHEWPEGWWARARPVRVSGDPEKHR